MPSQLLSVAAAALPLIGLATAGPTATPYSDGDCQNQMPQWTYSSRNGTKYVNQPFDTGAGVSANNNATLKGNYESFRNIKFSVPSAQTASGSGSLSNQIYWKFSKLDENCRVIFMSPFAQTERGTNIPGNIILNAGNGDACYYTDPGDTVYMSFCCGTGDCAAFNVGESVLNTKRDVSGDLPVKDVGGPRVSIAGQLGSHKRELPSMPGGGPSFSLAQHFNQAQAKAKRGPQPKPRTVRLGSLSARAQAQIKKDFIDAQERDTTSPNAARGLKNAARDAKKCDTKDTDCWNKEWAKCKITASAQPISMPGQQQSVSAWTNCNGGTSNGCEISKSVTTQHSSEVSVSQTNADTTGSSTSSSSTSEETNTNTVETTNTDGYSLSVGASIGWGPFSVSTDATTSHETTTDNTNTNTKVNSETTASSQSFSNTVSNSTGHALTTAQGETVTQTFEVMPGGYAILTFLPFYDCYTVSVDCGSTWIGPLGKTKTVSSQICTPAMRNGAAKGSYSLLYSNAAN